jgi:GntR family transcriptional regulator
MLPFTVQFEPGGLVAEPVCHAVWRAVIAGKLCPGERFPSIRQLSRTLRINHNTAHKVITRLTLDGLLESRPGIGAFIVAPKLVSKQVRTCWLNRELERVAVKACQLGISFDELAEALCKHWDALTDNGKTRTSARQAPAICAQGRKPGKKA